MTLDIGKIANTEETEMIASRKIGENPTIAQIKEMFPLSANVKNATLVNRLGQNGIRPTMKSSRPIVYQTAELTQAKLKLALAPRLPNKKDSIESFGGLIAYETHLAVKLVINSIHSGDNGMIRGRHGSLVRNI